MSLPAINQTYLVDFLVKLLNISSPTGFTEPALAFVEEELSQFSQLQLTRTRKGALVAKWEVERIYPPSADRPCRHAGGRGKEFKSNGRLKLGRIGGIQWPSVETEGVWILPSNGEKVRGSVLIDSASGHVHGAAGSETPRTDDHMEVVSMPARPLKRRRVRWGSGSEIVLLLPRGSDEWFRPLTVPG